MQWHSLFGKKRIRITKAAQNAPLGLALEPRMMFDGAVAATTADAAATTEPSTTESSSEADSSTDVTSSSDPSDNAIAVSNTSEPSKEVVFIDTSLTDYQTLLDNVPTDMDVVLLDGSQDGLEQIVSWAQEHSGYDAIHILSHGSDGQIQLGGITLDQDSALARQDDLAQIGAALSENGDILFYGCDIAQETGESLVSLLAQLTSADIAASTDTTGSGALGGDWELESATGTIESDSLAFASYSSVFASVTIGTGNSQTVDANSNGGYEIGQSFTATKTGLLEQIRVAQDAAPVLSDWTLTIYDGVGTSGTVLATQTGSTLADTVVTASNYSFSSITITDSVSLTSGQQYTFIFSPGDSIDLVYFMTNQYTGGDLYAINGFYAGYDLAFEVVQADAFSLDATSTVTSSATLTEPSTFATTAISSGTATQLLDFTISDSGTSDGVSTTVTALSVDVTGTTTDAERSNMVFLLNGPDATNVVGTYSSTSDTITFSGLSLDISDGGNETYTISAYYNDDTGSNDLTDGSTLILSVNAADFTASGTGSSFASSQSDVTNGSGAAVDITATKLVYSQSPSSTITSGSAFGTQPVLMAVDARGNVDTDFTSTVSLTESSGSAGTLSGITSLTAVSGVATFTGMTYYASTDQESFVLTAAATGVTSAATSSITADVVATQLIFSIQPSPTSIQSGQSTSFTTVPVLQAVDGNGIVDTGYSTDIVISITDPNDGTVDGTVNSLSGTGDSDGDGTTVTLTPSSGSVTFTGLTLQYTNSGATESIALQATSGAFSAVNSTTITSSVDASPVISNLAGDSVAWPGTGSTVLLDAGSDLTATDTELDALNSGNGDWSGGSLTVQRQGTALPADVFAFDTSGASFTVSGSNLQSGGLTFATYSVTGGVLSISFTSSATSATTALVQDVMQHITYRNDTPYGDATIRFTLSDGTSSSTADVSVTSDTIYVDQLTDDSDGDTSDGFSLREAIAQALTQSGNQTIVFGSSLASQTLTLDSSLSITEAITFDTSNASGITLSGSSITLSDALTLSNGSSDTLTIASAMTGTGSVVKEGSGTLTLSGTNSYSGTTTVSAGYLSIATDSNLGTGNVALAASTTLQITSASTIDNAIQLSGNATVENSDAVTLSSVISGSANFTKSGAGTLTLSGSNTYTGTTVITAGILSVAGDGNLGTDTLALTGGNLTVTGSSVTIDNAISLSSSATLTNANDITLSGIVSGSGSLSKVGAGQLTLTGTNIYTGTTSISAGTLAVSSDSNLGTGNLILSGGTLSLTSSTTIDNAITLTGSNSITTSAAVTLTGTISGTGNITKNGSSTLTLAGSNTYSGTTTVNSGTLSVTGDSNLGSGALTLAASSTLNVTGATTIDNAITLTTSALSLPTATSTTTSAAPISVAATINHTNNVTLSGVISGSIDLTKTGAGTLTLSGTNTYTGSTTISAGTLAIASDSNLGSGSITFESGTTFSLTAASTIDNNLVLAGNSTITNSADSTFSGVISGAYSLGKSGSGTLTLSGSNTFTGDLNINAGAVSLTGSLASAVQIASGTTLGGSGTIAGLVTVASGGTLAPGSSPGILVLQNGLSMNSGSTLSMELNSTTAGTGYDQLQVIGSVAINGAQLNLSLGYTPTLGDSFSLIDNDAADAISGQFSSLSEGSSVTINGQTGEISYVGGTGNDVVFTITNSAPVISNLDGDSVTYTAGDSAVLIDDGSNTLLSDADSSNMDGGFVTVTLTSGQVTSEDVLSMRNQGTGSGEISLDSGNVSYEGTLIGTATGGTGNTSLIISLDSHATPQAVQALLRNLTYSNTHSATEINTGSRTISITVSDGDGGTSSTNIVSVSVLSGNQAPTTSGIANQQVTANEAYSYTLPATTFSDADTNDTLTLSATLTGGGSLPSWLSFDAATGTFTGRPSTNEVGSSLSITVTATDNSAASVSASFTLAVTQSTLDLGVPEFRSSDQSSRYPSYSEQQNTVTSMRVAPANIASSIPQSPLSASPVNNVFTSTTVATNTSYVFQSATYSGLVSETAQRQLPTTAPLQDSDAGSFTENAGFFPSLANTGIAGGRSDLATVFSGLRMPSITPMQVFSESSWNSLNVNHNALDSQPNGLNQRLNQLDTPNRQRVSDLQNALRTLWPDQTHSRS